MNEKTFSLSAFFLFLLLVAVAGNLLLITHCRAENLLFHAPVHTSQATGSLKLFTAQGEMGDYFEVLAAPDQSVWVCGHSVVYQGATPIADTDGITTYRLTQDSAEFGYFGSSRLCSSKPAFQSQPVASDGLFLLKWKKKQESRHHKDRGWLVAVDASSGESIGFGNGGDSPGRDELFKPGRQLPPFFFYRQPAG